MRAETWWGQAIADAIAIVFIIITTVVVFIGSLLLVHWIHMWGLP